MFRTPKELWKWYKKAIKAGQRKKIFVLLEKMRTWTIESGADWATDKKRFRSYIMDDFGIDTLSDDCSYEKADKFIEFLEPKAKLAEKELSDDVDLDDSGEAEQGEENIDFHKTTVDERMTQSMTSEVMSGVY